MENHILLTEILRRYIRVTEVLLSGWWNFSNIEKQSTKGGIMKRYSKNMQQIYGEQRCTSVISIRLQSHFIEITFSYGCSPVSLLHICRTSFLQEHFWGTASKYFIKNGRSISKDFIKFIYKSYSQIFRQIRKKQLKGSPFCIKLQAKRPVPLLKKGIHCKRNAMNLEKNIQNGQTYFKNLAV